MNRQSRLVVVHREEIPRDKAKHIPARVDILTTGINKGRKYPYNSNKRGWHGHGDRQSA